MSWILQKLRGIYVVLANGVPLPSRPYLNIIGATPVDNPQQNRTDLTFTFGSSASLGSQTPTQFTESVGVNVPTTDDSTVALLAPAIAIPANSLVTVTARVKAACRSASKLYGGVSTYVYVEAGRSGTDTPGAGDPAAVADLSSPPGRPLAAPFAGGMVVSAAADNGSGRVRLTVDSTAKAASGNTVTISGLTTCTEANGTWAVDVIDSMHVDLRGVALVHAGADSGTAFLLGSISLAFVGTSLQIQARGVKPAPWLQSETVVINDVRWDATSNKSYVCVQAGTTAGSGTGPSGTGLAITDGTAKWDFLATGRACPLVWLVADLQVAQL